jgi:hypothetical protein
MSIPLASAEYEFQKAKAAYRREPTKENEVAMLDAFYVALSFREAGTNGTNGTNGEEGSRES